MSKAQVTIWCEDCNEQITLNVFNYDPYEDFPWFQVFTKDIEENGWKMMNGDYYCPDHPEVSKDHPSLTVKERNPTLTERFDRRK